MMLIGITATAQTEHLTFKGVPIDGTLTSFVSKMKQKGLSHLGTRDGTAVLEGEFAGHKGCTVIVVSDHNGIVYRVGAVFPEQDTWTRLYNNYLSLKNLLTQKYGEPSNCIEEFQTHQRDSDIDDNSKMQYVQFDQCKYISSFSSSVGDIELRIDHDDRLKSYVVLIYEDNSNSGKVQSNALEDL